MKRISLIILFVPLIHFGQTNLTQQSLELIERSIQNSNTLKNARSDLSIDSIETRGIRQNYIPTLTMNGFYAYGAGKFNVDVPTFDLPISGVEIFDGESEFDAKGHVFNTNLTAKMLLFGGMQVNYGSKASKEKIRAKNYLLETEKSKLIKDLIDTFDKIELLEASKRVLENSEMRLQKEKEKAIIAVRNGLITPYDREKISAAELKLESKKTEVEGNLELLYLKLSIMSDVSTESIREYDFQLKPWVLENVDANYTNRAELKALRASIDAYNYKLKMNKSTILPKVEAFATLTYFNLFDTRVETPFDTPVTEQPIDLDLNHFTLFPAYFMGVGFQWDIFNGLKNSNETQITRIQKNMAETKKNEAQEQLQLFEKKVKIDFSVKNKQLLIKQKEKEVASNSLNLAIKSYEQGLIDISERLAAEVNFQEAALAYYLSIAKQRQSALDVLSSKGSLDINHINN